MPLHAGIDIGSQTCEVVVLDDTGRTVADAMVLTGARSRVAAERALAEALDRAGVGREALGTLVATGYGRDRLDGRSAAATEIRCHARGAWQLRPATRLVLDIGGQDCKAVRVDERGRVADFAMNDKCAAGTGRFFEVMARALEIDLDELGPLALQAAQPAVLSSICTVFAESEVVSLVAADEPVANLAAGLCHAAAERVRALAQRVGVVAEVTVTGGGALNVGLLDALGKALGVNLSVPDEPQMVGALGAALLGWESCHGQG